MLFEIFVPSSIYILNDLMRIVHGKFIECDIKLYDPEENLTTIVKNTKVIEDLGKIEYILTDKTGTLTKNQMNLKVLLID